MKNAGILSPRLFFKVFKVIRVFKDFKEKTTTDFPADLKGGKAAATLKTLKTLILRHVIPYLFTISISSSSHDAPANLSMTNST